MEVQDAYQAYIQARREEDDLDKLVNIEMPVSEVASIYRVIFDSVEEAKDSLSAESKHRWTQILRKLSRGIEAAL